MPYIHVGSKALFLLFKKLIYVRKVCRNALAKLRVKSGHLFTSSLSSYLTQFINPMINKQMLNRNVNQSITNNHFGPTVSFCSIGKDSNASIAASLAPDSIFSFRASSYFLMLGRAMMKEYAKLVPTFKIVFPIAIQNNAVPTEYRLITESRHTNNPSFPFIHSPHSNSIPLVIVAIKEDLLD